MAGMRAAAIKVQRKCACGANKSSDEPCEACSKGTIRRSAGANARSFEAAPPSVTHTLNSPGEPLDVAARARFEPMFRHDFSQVRVHRDSAAAASAREIDAEAYTVGQHVVFGRGAYAPGTAHGSKLLGHELAHVVQQHGAPTDAGPLEIGRAEDPLERDADALAERAERAEQATGGSELLPVRSKRNMLRRKALDPSCTKSAKDDAAKQKAATESRRQAFEDRYSKGERVRVNDECSAEEVPADEWEQHLALDQITIVVLSKQACGNCANLEADLARFCRVDWGRRGNYAGESRNVEAERKFTLKTLVVYTDPPDAGETLDVPPARAPTDKEEPFDKAEVRAHYERWKDASDAQKAAARRIDRERGSDKGVPVPMIYLDRDQKEDGRHLGGNAELVEQAASDIASTASKREGINAGIGAAIGAGLGIAAGIGAAFGAAALGVAAGWAGLIGLGVGLLVTGLGALIGYATSTPHGEALSDARREEVIAYLCTIDKQGPLGDKGLARDAITLWGEIGYHGDDPRFSVAMRRILLRDLMIGFTGDRQERAIIKLFERSSDESFVQILDTGLDLKTPGGQDAPATSIYDVLDEIQGAERDEFLKMLSTRYPALGPKQSKEDVDRKTKGLAIADPKVREVMVAAFNASNMGKAMQKKSMLEATEAGSRECGAQFFRGPKGTTVFTNKTEMGKAALDDNQPAEVVESPIFCSPERRGIGGGAPNALEFPLRDQPVAVSFHTHPIGRSEQAYEIPSGRDYGGVGVQTINSETKDEGDRPAANPDRLGNEHYVIGPYNIYVILYDPATKRRSLRRLGRTKDILGVGSDTPPADRGGSALGV